jgi:hypothetical protein
LERLGTLEMLTPFFPQIEGATLHGTACLPGDTVIDVVAHGEAAMPKEERPELA